MLSFAGASIRLAEIARRAGRAADAVEELWPVVARLEARLATGPVERDVLALLGRARLALGVSLGTVLPEQHLAAAARWTGRALALAQRLDDADLLSQALQMHGNELRKAGRIPAAIARLQRAVTVATDPGARGAALALLARAAGEHGNAALFDDSFAQCRRIVDAGAGRSLLVDPFSLREIRLRGLAATGRAPAAMRVVRAGLPGTSAPAPQWQVMERVTTGWVLLAGGRPGEAEAALQAALVAAEAGRLPHQVQRAIRVAEGRLPEVARDGRAALRRLAGAGWPPCPAIERRPAGGLTGVEGRS